MPTFIEKTPNGVETWIDDRNGDPGIDIHYSQDVEPILNYTAELRKTDEPWKRGVKADWVHYAVIPPVEQMKWMNERGVIVGKDADHDKKMFELLNTEYQYLKTTTKVHRPK